MLAKETAADGVNVNTLYPSVKIDTGFFAHLSESERSELSSPDILNGPAVFLAGLAPGDDGHAWSALNRRDMSVSPEPVGIVVQERGDGRLGGRISRGVAKCLESQGL